jgi:tetratricopeptide (TPR) repeat protein/predicted Ser/Thr protein kinase
MALAPGVIVFSLVGLVLTRGWRSFAAFACTALVLWLNLWWLLTYLGQPGIERLLPSFVLWAQPPGVMAIGHLVAVALFLIAVGLFSPRRGSPADYALRAAQRGDHLAAGEFWLEAKRPRRALRAFERAHAWARAGETARTLGMLERAVKHFQNDSGESLATAAQIAARLRDDKLAQTLWARYGSYLVDNSRPEQAIEPFIRAADPRRAANAAELALGARKLTANHADIAMRAAREAKRLPLAASIAEATGRSREAGELFLLAEQPLDAARAFGDAGDALRAADALRSAGHTEQASRLRARRLAEVGKTEEALAEYESAGMLTEAAAALTKLGRHTEAFERYRRAGMRREAADLALAHLDPREAASLYGELQEWDRAARAWEKANEPLEAAHAYERSGDFHRAEELLRQAKNSGELARLQARLGRVEEGFQTLFRANNMRGAWDLLSSYAGTFPALAQQLAELGTWLAAEVDIPTAISAVQRAIAGLPARADLLPAFYTLAVLLEDHGDLRAAEATWQKVVDVDYSYKDAAQRMQLLVARRASTEAPTSGNFPTMTKDPATTPEPQSRYLLETELGRGGMGVVYRANDNRLGRTVAIKVLNPRQHTPDAIRRFEREAQAAAGLSHPGIVHIYDFDRGFGSHFISMEFVSGPTLNQLVKDEPAFVRRNLFTLMFQIADAVAFAHARHIVHRDLKPANMVLADRRQVKILDFGIARRLDELDLSASGATGTPYYMAPEQVLGEIPDERTDIYSLGVTFFQLATGTLPFATGNILRAHLEQPPPDPQALAPGLEPALGHLILLCLKKTPDDRPRDGGTLVNSLATLNSRSRP